MDQLQPQSSFSPKTIILIGFIVVIVVAIALYVSTMNTTQPISRITKAITTTIKLITTTIEEKLTANKSCVRGTTINTWETEYDACDLAEKAQEKCSLETPDGRWAYDAYWDAANANGINCGKDQAAYGKGDLKWQNMCSKLKQAKYKYTDPIIGCQEN